jgi:hypothetical protein
MEIKLHDEQFPWLEIYGLYTTEERELMFNEILFLSKNNKLKGPEETGTAWDLDLEKGKIPRKNNRGVYVDEVYHDRTFSDMLMLNRKTFNIGEVGHWFFDGYLPKINKDSTLLSYYEDECYYKPHRDFALITALTWFYKEPKLFEGGDLIFSDHNITIKPDNEVTILFPSIIKHQVTDVIMKEEYKNKQFGRFTMSQFMHLV